MDRNELIAYFSRSLRESRGLEADEESLALCAATLADAFLENRVERPRDAGEPARQGST